MNQKKNDITKDKPEEIQRDKKMKIVKEVNKGEIFKRKQGSP